MSENDQIKKLFADAKAIITDGHFVYNSGKHGPAYINKDAIYLDPDTVSQLCSNIAWKVLIRGLNVEVVIAPAVGAIVLSQWTTYYLNAGDPKLASYKVKSVYADKDGDNFVIKRGYETCIPGKRVLVVEDLFTTGGSTKKVVEAVRALGGKVVGVAGLANRGNVDANMVGNVPVLISLLDVRMDMYEESDCPLCKNNVPINTTLGHGKAFLEKRKCT